jgi:hypothetical protein
MLALNRGRIQRPAKDRCEPLRRFVGEGMERDERLEPPAFPPLEVLDPVDKTAAGAQSRPR